MEARLDLLTTALFAGCVYASLRVCLTAFYPAVVGYLWQFAIGPKIVSHYPSLGQSEDRDRLSYIPTRSNQPFVISWGFLSPSGDDISHGLRDGFLLGVLVALVPELFQTSLLTFVFAFVFAKTAWRVSRATGALRTDKAMSGIKEILMFASAVFAIQVTGFLKF